LKKLAQKSKSSNSAHRYFAGTGNAGFSFPIFEVKESFRVPVFFYKSAVIGRLRIARDQFDFCVVTSQLIPTTMTGWNNA
jgi:hypothetical protein